MNDIEIIKCRSAAQIASGAKWIAGEPVEFLYMPGGRSNLQCGFRETESVTITIECDEQTADSLQQSFDHICATEGQEPIADIDHQASSNGGSTRAAIRFPAGQVTFRYGTWRGHEGVILKGGEPTGYGATVVNDRTFRGFSPVFSTDCDLALAKCRNGHWSFPSGVRGSVENPARITGTNFVVGSLTNLPAFKSRMPFVAAHHRPASWMDSPVLAAVAGRMEENRLCVSRIVERSERQRTLAVLEFARKNKGGQP